MSACACLAHALKLQTDIRHGLLGKPPEGKAAVNPDNYLEAIRDLIGKFNPKRTYREAYKMPGHQAIECLKMEVMRNIASLSDSGSAADLDTMWCLQW
ncbi:MAG: hypothetical protein FJW31_28925 [Acidobacteria bacterium]|nr:hypothetical protein [Acidobacteriota bacterium]